jgi:hypothetical protein
MKSIISYFRDNLVLCYLIIFLGMILPSLLLFGAVEKSDRLITGLLLSLVILANLAAVFPPKHK